MLPAVLHPWIAIAVVLAVFLILQLRRSVPLDLLFLGGVLVVALAGILTPAQALAGFSNPAVLAIGGLLALTAGLKKCGFWIGLDRSCWAMSIQNRRPCGDWLWPLSVAQLFA